MKRLIIFFAVSLSFSVAAVAQTGKKAVSSKPTPSFPQTSVDYKAENARKMQMLKQAELNSRGTSTGLDRAPEALLISPSVAAPAKKQ